jgi:hypothetical protein
MTPSRGGDFQKRKIDGLCKQLYLLQKFRKIQEKLIKITKKGNFDGLCKQLFNSENTKKIEK